MNRFPVFLIAVIAALSSSSVNRVQPIDLLDKDDDQLMRDDAARGPALSAPLDGEPYWASYNQWLCFPIESIAIDCMEADYDGPKAVPTIHITHDDHFFEFSMDPDPAPNCDKIIAQWKTLLENEGAFCAYAAPLQELDVSLYDTTAQAGSLWMISRLKTEKGSWMIESDDNWSKESDEPESSDSM